jgi:hypothetical protein
MAMAARRRPRVLVLRCASSMAEILSHRAGRRARAIESPAGVLPRRAQNARAALPPHARHPGAPAPRHNGGHEDPAMKRALVISLLVMVALVLGLLGTALLRAVPGGLPAPDPAQLIHLRDGTSRPLSEVLALAEQGSPLVDVHVEVIASPDAARLAPDEAAARQKQSDEIQKIVEDAIRSEEGTVFHLAEIARREGRLDEAEALYLSIPEDDPRWARAQRRIAWDVLAKGKGEPRQGVMYAKKALAADPFNANSWQDFARVCAGTLGIDVD